MNTEDKKFSENGIPMTNVIFSAYRIYLEKRLTKFLTIKMQLNNYPTTIGRKNIC